MNYSILNVHSLAETYEDFGLIVICDGDTRKARNIGVEDEE